MVFTDIRVGQKVWVKRNWNNQSRKPKEDEISKIGNKYFYLKGDVQSKFFICNGFEKTELNDIKKLPISK